MTTKPKVRTCLWFDSQGEDAARFYVSLLPDSFIETVSRPDPDGPALVIDFTLAGAPYQALNGGPVYPQTPAASISVLTTDQAETDTLWTALVAGGGKAGQCGWLTDRFGASWQIVPERLLEMQAAPDRTAAERANQAMLRMGKIDIATLETAFRGESAGRV